MLKTYKVVLSEQQRRIIREAVENRLPFITTPSDLAEAERIVRRFARLK